MAKRILSVILVLVLIFSIIPSAQANNTKLLAITFDDGPSYKFTPLLLDALKERNVKATFFLVGYMLAANPDIAERAFSEGHQLANHTYNHPWFSKLPQNGIVSEIESVNEMLREIVGEKSFLLRAPYGDITSTVKRVAPAPLIQWSVDPTNGYTSTSEETMYNNFMRTVRDGSIILLHDTNAKNLNVAIRAIDALLEQGYEFVTLDELFRLRGITPENGTVYYSLPSGNAETAFDEGKLSEHWAYDSILLVRECGIIQGDSVGFKPNEYLTRAMAATILLRLAGETGRIVKPFSAEDSEFIEEKTVFVDVPEGMWYSEAVTWAHENGYVQGIGDMLFDPDSFVTREQFYAILSRFAAPELRATPQLVPFSYRDDVRTSLFATESVQCIRSAGFRSKNDPEIFRPGDMMTRAEAAEMIAFMLELLD